MADKRTTLEVAAGASPRKRAAPTIDLTATEVQPAAAAGEPPPMPEQPEAEHDTARADKEQAANESWSWLSTNIKGPALAAGAAGAAMMTLVLFVLWLTGLVPIRYAGSTAMRARVTGLEMQLHDLQSRPTGAVDTKSIDALTGRVAQIEDAIAKLAAGDPNVADRVATAENAMKSLGLALAALNRRSDDIAANAALARDRADAAGKEVTELRTSVQDSVKNAAKEAIENFSAGTTATDTPARLALSAALLRDAALSGAPFAAALAQAKSLGADEKRLMPLGLFAATGVPTQTTLVQELRALVPAMLKLSGAQTPAGGFLERLQANAENLVRISPVDVPTGDDPSAVLARIEIDAAHGDIAGALTDLGKLSDAQRAPAQSWITKANERQAALMASREFAAETARALGKQ